MCIEANFTKPTITTEPIIAYKVVRKNRDGDFFSLHPSSWRNQQTGFETQGKSRQYVVGKRHQSTMRSTPGFYCYLAWEDARYAAHIGGTERGILKIKIPAKTKVVYGKSFWGQAIICCERLVVEELLA